MTILIILLFVLLIVIIALMLQSIDILKYQLEREKRKVKFLAEQLSDKGQEKG